jgi:hypothetical protein
MSDKLPHHQRHRPAPEVTRGAFPVLATFVRGYLHEDWVLDYETAHDARDEFLRDALPAERREFHEECEIFHQRTGGLSIDQLRQVLADGLGSAWSPADVAEVRDVLRVPTRRT